MGPESNPAPESDQERPAAAPRPLETEKDVPQACAQAPCDLFGLPLSSGPKHPALRRSTSLGDARKQLSAPRRSGSLPTLFDFQPADPAASTQEVPEPQKTPGPLFAQAPSPAEALTLADPPAAQVEWPTVASGEKAKAQDILAAIRTLKTIEQAKRTATNEEKLALARFSGFGPVALSIFPDPVSGGFKDAAWQSLGEELQSLLTPEEYASAKRTTFNAFFASPTVVAAMHEALGRLGISANATVLEPGCGSGNFIRLAPKGMRFIGVELDTISGRIANS
jgi:hypothetical protein